MRCVLGVDIGTSSSKGVLVDRSGRVLAMSVIEHTVQRPQPGWVEMDADVWWQEFKDIAQTLTTKVPDSRVESIGVSGMGPCVLITDERDMPIRPAILYGVDTRAVPQISRLNDELGHDQIASVGGSLLTSQAAGPKIAWVADEEPEAYSRGRRLFMPASWLVRKLTGTYVLDHQSASQVSPLYDIDSATWHEPWWQKIAPGIEPPTLKWAGEIAGAVTESAARATGLTEGTPVITGTIDAWSEAVSVGAHSVGDLMLMYGTTMFFIATQDHTIRTPSMWSTAGAFAGTRNLAGGLSAAGALTAWIRDLTGTDYSTLLREAAESSPGAHGLAMLPYFAGERTPIQDPDARGVVAGLTLSHRRGDLYRAALEATALAARHNIETMRDAGCDIRRIVAVGGGTQGRLWMQVVSDATGIVQEVPRITIGASYGAAFLASTGIETPGKHALISEWNPIETTVDPNPSVRDTYDNLFRRYRSLYASTRDIAHELAAVQQFESRKGDTTQ